MKKGLTLEEAIVEVKANININFTHVALFKEPSGYLVELHCGHAGNCCCVDDEAFVWRQSAPYIETEEIEDLYEHLRRE